MLQMVSPTLGQNMGAWAEILIALEPHQQQQMQEALRLFRQAADNHNTMQLFNMRVRTFEDGIKPIRAPWRSNANYAAPTAEHVEGLFIEVARRLGVHRLVGLIGTEATSRFAAVPSTPHVFNILDPRSSDQPLNQYTTSSFSYPASGSMPNVEALFQAH